LEQAMTDSLLALLPGSTRDRTGNVTLTLGQGAPKRLLQCPLDEVGYVVGNITGEGYLLLRRVGARTTYPLFDQQLEGHRVTVFGSKGPIPGVVAVKSTHLTRGRVATGAPSSSRSRCRACTRATRDSRASRRYSGRSRTSRPRVCLRATRIRRSRRWRWPTSTSWSAKWCNGWRGDEGGQADGRTGGRARGGDVAVRQSFGLSVRPGLRASLGSSGRPRAPRGILRRLQRGRA